MTGTQEWQELGGNIHKGMDLPGMWGCASAVGQSLEHSEQRLGEAAETQRRAAGRGQPGPGMLLFTTKKLLICASGEGEGFS